MTYRQDNKGFIDISGSYWAPATALGAEGKKAKGKGEGSSWQRHVVMSDIEEEEGYPDTEVHRPEPTFDFSGGEEEHFGETLKHSPCYLFELQMTKKAERSMHFCYKGNQISVRVRL